MDKTDERSETSLISEAGSLAIFEDVLLKVEAAISAAQETHLDPVRSAHLRTLLTSFIHWDVRKYNSFVRDRSDRVEIERILGDANRPVATGDAQKILRDLAAFHKSTAVIVPVLGRIGDNPSDDSFTVRATQWTLVRRTAANTGRIIQLTDLISDVLEHMQTSNLSSEQRALDEIERAQLVAILATALKMLEAPMVEMSLLKKTAAMLKRAAAKALEKQVESTFAFAAGFAAGKITEYLPYLHS